MNTEAMVTRLIFFIPLFYLTVSLGLPPGTTTAMLKPIAMRPPSNQKLLPSTRDSPATSTTRFINANDSEPPSPSTAAITTVSNSTPANGDVITTVPTRSTNKNTPSHHDADHDTSDEERGKERHQAGQFLPPTSDSNLATGTRKANEKIIPQPSHDSHYQNHHDSLNSNSTTTATATTKTASATSSKEAGKEGRRGASPQKTSSGGRGRVFVRLPRSDGITRREGERERERQRDVDEDTVGNMMGMTNSRDGARSADSTLVSMTLQQQQQQQLQHVDADGEKNSVEGSAQNLPPVALSLVQNYTTKVPLRGSCNSTFRCMGDFVECSRGHCRCQDGYAPSHDERDVCRDLPIYNLDLPQTDPTMIGVIIGLILMSFTLCIVLRLFAKARFSENRTIFNTPNPRLMNVSLLKGGKQLLRGNSGGNNPSRSRRGSQTSVASAVAAEAAAHQRSQAAPQQASTASAASPPNALSPTSPQNEIQTQTQAPAPTSQGMGGYPRPKTLRQASVENEIAGAASVSKAAKSKYRQDSVSSNV